MQVIRLAGERIATARIGIAVVVVVLLVATSVSRGQNAARNADDRAATAATAATAAREAFEKQVEPLLKRRCYECHSHAAGQAKGGLVLDSRAGWARGGSSGPAVTPGQPDTSLLIQAIRRDGLEMPPNAKLPADEIAILERWVASGAFDPRETAPRPAAAETPWAFRPLRAAATPVITQADWPREPLDAFLLARLEQAQLAPSPLADRATLLRRVTLDLTGLPPTPEEIDEFVRDESVDAWERVVDRLLHSPAFGDHWARRWFDISCYADLADVQGNIFIRDAWRYRDYVIASLNSDKPFDRFVTEQLAGDLLPYADAAQRREQLIATGYLAIGPWTLQNYIKKQLDADVVDHQIDRIGRTFLGQTLSCARCHDHKFDPIPTRDYYALAGIFHSTRTTGYDGPGVWSQISHAELPLTPQQLAQRDERRRRVTTLQAEQLRRQSEFVERLLRLRGGSSANVLTLEAPVAANERGRDYELRFLAGPSVWADRSQRTLPDDGLYVELVRGDGSSLAAFRHAPGAWAGTRESQKLTAAQFAYQGDGSGPLRIRLTTSTPGSGRFGGALDDLELTLAGETLFRADFNDLRPGPHVGAQADTGLRVLAGATVPGWKGDGVNHSHAVELAPGNFAVQFYGGGLVPLATLQPASDIERQAQREALEIESALRAAASELSRLVAEDSPESALAVRDQAAPCDSPIYRRGDFRQLGPVVPRGFLSALPTRYAAPIPPQVSGRAQLAAWLTSPDNPTPPRVLVNRIWAALFGQGLVRSVDYFGRHGETPSHPELLDALALRFQSEDAWSLKRTVRRMALSQAYQMGSPQRDEAWKIDPENRYLWRMPRRRLSAESIRDAMLAASGELNLARGGSPLCLELDGNIAGAGGNVNPAEWVGKVSDSIRYRRTVYWPLRRERPAGELEILSVFDFPHPNDIVGARPETTVATQALFLLNSPFVKDRAAKLAERLAREAPDDMRQRVERLYLLVASRSPAPEEIDAALAFVSDLEPPASSTDSSAAKLSQVEHDKARAAAWTQLCHALLSSNQFLFRE